MFVTVHKFDVLMDLMLNKVLKCISEDKVIREFTVRCSIVARKAYVDVLIPRPRWSSLYDEVTVKQVLATFTCKDHTNKLWFHVANTKSILHRVLGKRPGIF